METSTGYQVSTNTSDATLKQHICKICNKVLSNPSGLKCHMTKVHYDENWISCKDSRKCEYCGKVLCDKGTLDTHLKRKHMKDINPEIQNSVQESKQENVGSKVMCELKCGKDFKNRTAMKIHVNKTHNGKRFKCNACDKSFFSKTNMIRHQDQVHGKNEKVPCDLCKKTFPNNEYLLTHLEKCGKHICNVCDESFLRAWNLKSHISKVHEVSNKKKRKCEISSVAFKSQSELKHHIDFVHEKKSPYLCHICNKTVSSNNFLKKHIAAHEGRTEKLKCDKCDKKYNHMSSLYEHKRIIHDGIKYPCKRCDKTFGEIKKLRDHLERVHEGKNNIEIFECNVCSKTYTSKKGFKIHFKSKHVYQNPKTYKCDPCDKNFRIIENYFEHLSANHNEKIFECGLCKKPFIRSLYFEEHPNCVERLKKPNSL